MPKLFGKYKIRPEEQVSYEDRVEEILWDGKTKLKAQPKYFPCRLDRGTQTVGPE